MKRILFLATVMMMTFAAVAQKSPISVRWEMVKNNAEKGYYSSRFVIKNVSDAPLGNNWQFYFNQFSRRLKLADNVPVDIKEVSTTYYQVTPNSRYQTLKPGEELTIDMLMRGSFVNICYSPDGGHVVLNSDTSHPLAVTIEKAPLDNPEQWASRPLDYPDGNRMYAFNETLKKGTGTQSLRSFAIFPAPKSVVYSGGFTTIGNLVTVKKSMLDLVKGDKAKELLIDGLRQRGIYESKGQKVKIWLNVDKKALKNGAKEESYQLVVRADTVTITAPATAGLMNGVKTLLAAIDHSKNRQLDNAVVSDAPDFPYRGFMLDIARNYISFDNYKRVIDLLSYYKINRVQFHFTDDEAWRLEIPGLPELTEVGSRRGCTLDEKEFLAQIFAGNGDPNDKTGSANGFYTRAQFIELLKYADARGVKIIPEIETPGHARAAIIAMKARYNKYIGTDKALAEQYKLWDENDKSVFTSAQSYHDNVLNVAQEGVINFVVKVVDELALMYKEAGLTLDIVHLGGDEVPKGAWEGSPAVQELMKAKGLKSEHEVSEYYIRRITDNLFAKKIKIEGWQEVGLGHGDAYNAEIAPRFAGVNAWSTVGRLNDVPHQLANAGYPTILSNVTNFYIDMGYSWHQYDQGLHWGGSVDEYASWYAQPLNLFKTARVNYDGSPVDFKQSAEGKVALVKKENIIGVQGQLWGETLRSFTQVQYLMLPKILGLAHRGWNANIEWNDDSEESFMQHRADYNEKVDRELQVLADKGYNFRLGLPGVMVKDGMLYANTQYAGEVVRYTTDGSEPTQNSPVWTAPVKLASGTKMVKAKAYYLGKESLTTYLWP